MLKLAWSGPICCGTGHVLLIDGLGRAHLVPVDLDEAVFGTTSFREDPRSGACYYDTQVYIKTPPVHRRSQVFLPWRWLC